MDYCPKVHLQLGTLHSSFMEKRFIIGGRVPRQTKKSKFSILEMPYQAMEWKNKTKIEHTIAV